MRKLEQVHVALQAKWSGAQGPRPIAANYGVPERSDPTVTITFARQVEGGGQATACALWSAAWTLDEGSLSDEATSTASCLDPGRYATIVAVWVWSAAVATAPSRYPPPSSFWATRWASCETSVPFSTATVTELGLKVAAGAGVGAFVVRAPAVDRGLLLPPAEVTISRTATIAPTSATPTSPGTQRLARERVAVPPSDSEGGSEAPERIWTRRGAGVSGVEAAGLLAAGEPDAATGCGATCSPVPFEPDAGPVVERVAASAALAAAVAGGGVAAPGVAPGGAVAGGAVAGGGVASDWGAGVVGWLAEAGVAGAGVAGAGGGAVATAVAPAGCAPTSAGAADATAS